MERRSKGIVRWAATTAGAALLALGALAGGAAGPAAAAILIQSCPYTILAPGLYVLVLARDLTCPGTAVLIAADNVTLNLNGRTLTGDGGGDGIRAEGTDANPTLEGLRVKNGTVRGFRDGVHLEDAPGARVAGVTARDNELIGIRVLASPGARVEGNRADGNLEGIFTEATPRARIAGNTAAGNDFDGINVNFCDGCVVAANRANGNGDNGFDLLAITGTRVEGNTANGNEGDGIQLIGGDGGNLVRGNTTNNNDRSGIEVFGSEGNTLEGNAATGNTEFDLEDTRAAFPACPNTWRANRFATDNEGGGPAAGCIR